MSGAFRPDNITAGNFTTFTGTATPSTPVAGDTWAEWTSGANKALKWGFIWEYDGTRWLSPMEYTSVCNPGYSAAANLLLNVTLPAGLNIYVVDVRLVGNHTGGAPSGGSNCYTYYVVRSRQLATGVTQVGSGTVQILANPFDYTLSINTFLDAGTLTFDAVRTNITKAGTAGTVYIQESMRYRWARP